MSDSHERLESATLGGGCFWCLEAVYQEVPGVDRIVSGYAGGHTENPTYRQVCSEGTGHAEVVQVTFDPEEIPYRRILEIFFTIHDPTQLNRQGADRGTQYRSIILTHSDDQRRVADEVIAEMEGVFSDPVVTEVEPLDVFYPAEDYHQDYYRQNRAQPYCQVVIEPKLAKYRARYGEGGS
ncbi:MAG: peptide-methionine (S)-S-oxide reductase MsrA [Acidobacteriota bacterium]|jgi:peptide-methionine (S)-S-oxide reductase